MTSRAERLTWEEALEALVRGLVLPEVLPERVAAAVALTVLPPDSPAGRQVRAWDPEPARGRGARRAVALALSLGRSRTDPQAVEEVRERYGVPGILAVLGLAALGRMGTTAGAAEGAIIVPAPPRDAETGDVLSMVRRSFGEVPAVWRMLCWDPPALRRWWGLHEAALAPEALTGQEKWLAMAAVAAAAGTARLGAPYRRLLLDGGWEDGELAAAARGEGRRLRRGMARGLIGARGLAEGTLDPARAWLLAADLSAQAARELVHLVELVRGLSTYLVLRPQ